MAHRRIKGLRYVRALDDKPVSIPTSRPRGVKALGPRYEKAIESVLPNAKRGQWFEFVDSNGQGYCQVDFVLQRDGFVVLLEAKHTWTLEGHLQLEQLYKPVVEMLTGMPTLGVVVCKRLVPEVSELQSAGKLSVHGNLWKAVEASLDEQRTVWHFIGGVGLAGRTRRSLRVGEPRWAS